MTAAPTVLPESREHPSPAARGQQPPAPGATGALFVRKTFLHLQEQKQGVPRRLLHTSSSAPALLRAPAALEVPSGGPPSRSGAGGRTTLLFRNVPYLLTRDKFVELLNSQGFRGQFDLVYVPMDFKTNQTLGYAFANAVSHEAAIRFFGVFEGFQEWPKKSQKICSVCWSNLQGLESNVRVYRNLTVMKGSIPDVWKPALFSQGDRVPFPAPTKNIQRGWKKHCGADSAAPPRGLRQGRARVRQRDEV